jgi:hypothetical protein
MKLRTKRIEQWIVIEGENPEEKAEFMVHPMSPKEGADLLEKCKKTDWEKGQRFSEVDFYKFKTHKIFATIIDWKGIEDEEGVSLKCINANKELVYLGNPEFIDKVLEKADDLYKQVQDDLEKEAKNLQIAQPGMETNR